MKGEAILSTAQVLERTQLSYTTLWRLYRAGDFPRPRRISTRRVGWLASEVTQWIENRRVVGKLEEASSKVREHRMNSGRRSKS